VAERKPEARAASQRRAEGAARAAGAVRHEVDAVYTWVDDSWPGYAEQLASYASSAHDRNPNRTRDNLDLLKYSLRSLERFAPWLRRVFLVTARPQLPRWLDPRAPDLHLVHHDEIFEPRHLPTFNSFAIVASLHRIPGLARRFVYLEDDRLLGRDVSPSDFAAADGRIRVWAKLGGTPAGARSEDARLSPWNLALARSNRLLDERYGRARRSSVKEFPLFVDLASFAELERQWKGEIAHTLASRFRAMGDVAPEHLYPHFLLEESRAVRVPPWRVYRDVSYLGLGNSPLATRLGLAWLRWRRPKLYCLNDNFGESPNPRVVRLVRRFLEASYPEPSRFERRPI
jgi:hypothetical protein